MYQVSNSAKTKFAEDSRMFQAKIKSGSTEITSGFISIKQYCQATSNSNISIGDAVASSVQVQMWKPDNFSFDSEFELSIGIYLDNGTVEYVPLGLYTAQKPTESNGVISFTAYDRIQSKLSGEYQSNLEYPIDGKKVISEIASMTGVPIDTSNLESGIMIPRKVSGVDMSVDESGNTVTAEKYENPYDGYSYRTVLSYLAQFYGKFVTVNRSGTIEFRWFTDSGYSLTSSLYYDDNSISDTKFTLTAITCNVGSSTLASGTGMSDVQIENPVMTQDLLDKMFAKIKGISYYPVTVKFFGDPRLDLGDNITMTKMDGTNISAPLMYICQDYDGGFITEIISYGKTEQENNASSPSKTALEQLENDVASVKEIVGKKADFEEVFAKMLTTDKIVFDNKTIVEMYERIIELNSSIEKTLNGLSIEVSSIANKKNITDNTEMQNYTVQEIPTLDNYPTTYYFFIFNSCSESLACSDTLLCGTNDYDNHLNNIAYNEKNGKYYIFEKNTSGVCGWRQMSDTEIGLLANSYASITVSKGEIDMITKKENVQCEVKITNNSMKATNICCC